MAYTTIDDPTQHFNTVLYTGDGNDGRTVTGVGFQPDFVWIKGRSEAEHHTLNDSVRGANNQIYSHLAYSNATDTDRLQSFDSDGFTLGTDVIVNQDTKTFVAWNWKAGTTGSGNTTGSGTSKAYSYAVNTTAGFSIIKYVGNITAGHTIPHHLGRKPDAILVKHLDDGQQWATQWSPLGAEKVMRFATTNAVSDSNTRWNDTEPTSTVFTVSTEHETNTDDGNHIAFCFANIQGYCQVGSYKGNGDANDGAMVYTGFKPAWVMIKRTDSTSQWCIIDNKRPGYNIAVNTLFANLSNVEATDLGLNFFANGFKEDTTNNLGADGGDYIYLAFAESPFVNSNGVPNNAE